MTKKQLKLEEKRAIQKGEFMKSYLTIAILMFVCAVSAFAKDKDHSADYKVGVLQSTESVNTGTFTSCDHGCMSQSTRHNVHYIVTDEGAYLISAPTSLGLSMLQGAFVSPNLPDVHIQWFLDDMHAGDKVLFAAECDKHNNCRFWLPKPDQQGKEYHTTGWFRPRVAKTNTNQLCGTGKLSAAVEAQVCNSTPAPAAAPVVAPVPEPTQATPQLTPQEKVSVQATSADLSDPRVARLKVMCEHDQIPANMRALTCDLYGFQRGGQK